MLQLINQSSRLWRINIFEQVLTESLHRNGMKFAHVTQSSAVTVVSDPHYFSCICSCRRESGQRRPSAVVEEIGSTVAQVFEDACTLRWLEVGQYSCARRHTSLVTVSQSDQSVGGGTGAGGLYFALQNLYVASNPIRRVVCSVLADPDPAGPPGRSRARLLGFLAWLPRGSKFCHEFAQQQTKVKMAANRLARPGWPLTVKIHCRDSRVRF